jgi:putative chitinase
MGLTRDQFTKIFTHCPAENVDTYLAGLNAAMDSAEINTTLRIAAFCAQIEVETNELSALVENLNYSAALLMKTWPRLFPNIGIANQYAHQSEKIGNYAYGNRLGNGPPESGDGYRYRGRGILQATGKKHYEEASAVTGIDFISDPDKMTDPAYMFYVGTAYWTQSGLNDLADQGNIKAVSETVNGGDIGLAEREAYYQVILQILGA